MPDTRAEAAVLAATADRFESVNEALQTMLRRLMSELETLETAWRGAGGRSFQQVQQAWAADQAALGRALTETAEGIRSAGARYVAADDAVAERVAGSHRGIRLPL
ncbi:WXG100 family type VII secretion target [Pilimelia anulata]|uniref:WXG100 family type VII secretion target n=1 Tax=Pilimelia anulata TaxID=53371 RepID=UPI0016663D9E|nr:WXG100 family type VII secretion target [Pilimelia anulata]